MVTWGKKEAIIIIIIIIIINNNNNNYFQNALDDALNYQTIEKEKWFDTSKYDKNDKRPLPIGKIKKYQVFLKKNWEEK